MSNPVPFYPRIGMVVTLALLSQAPAAHAATVTNDAGGISLVLPVEPTAQPQSDAEKNYGADHGRKLPEPELLQPRLDSALPAFRPAGNAQLRGEFKAAASDVLPDLVQRWISGFQHYYPNVHIKLAPPYAGSLGAKELVKETLDLAFVSRELKPDDITDFKAKFGYDPFSVPVSGGSFRHYGFLDAVVFFVNKDNPLAGLNFAQLDAIYSSTHLRGGEPIRTWGQLGLRGAWADKPVHAYGIMPWNGFEEFVRQRVLSVGSQRGEWRQDITFDPVVFPVAARVSKDLYGIGYSGRAYLDADVRLLALAPAPAARFIAPSYDNVASADYPLSRLIYLNLNKQPGKPLPPAVNEFIRFILSREGQKLVLDQAIYVPLRAKQADHSRALLERDSGSLQSR